MGQLTIIEIKDECEQYQAELETRIPNEVNECCDRLALLASLQARTGYLLAEAKRLRNDARLKGIGDMIVQMGKEGHWSAKVQNALVDSLASDETFVVDWLDRLNSACTHQADACRTIISKMKEEMRFSGYTPM